MISKLLNFSIASLIAFTCLNANDAVSQTNVTADIKVNTVWDKSNNPYIIKNDIVIDSGVTLVVKPGVYVTSDFGINFSIGGQLNMTAKVDTPITVENINFTLKKSANSYSSNQSGTTFEFCDFNGNFVNSEPSLSSEGPGFEIHSCSIVSYSKGLLYKGDTSNRSMVRVSNSKFWSFGDMVPLDFFGSNANLLVTGTKFIGFSNLGFSNQSEILNNTFDAYNYCDSIHLFDMGLKSEKNIKLSCNRFVNFSGPCLYIEEPDSTCNLGVLLCLFDSSDGFYSQKNGINSHKFNATISKSSFLKSEGYKISFSGQNAFNHVVKFNDCFWDSQDENEIKTFIQDAADAPSVGATVSVLPISANKYSPPCINNPFVNQINKQLQLLIHPNPGTGKFNVRTERTLNSLKVFAMNGQLICQFSEIEPGTELQLPEGVKGLFQLVYTDESGRMGSGILCVE